MIKVEQEGNFNELKKFLNKNQSINLDAILNRYGQQGVVALQNSTPKNTGKTASSWSYSIEHEKGKSIVSWYNDNVVNGVNIAIILQYGHGTKNGGYVQGLDYINPAMKNTFEILAEEMWRAVIS